MAKDCFTADCPNCGGGLRIARMSCPACAASVEGQFNLPRLARLTPEHRGFIELFVLSAGSLKEVGRTLGISYPTVRSRLDAAIAALRAVDEVRRPERLAVIEALEAGTITAEEAAKLLAPLSTT